ncbi:MAG TPA: rhomboid family intramembrane serine protease [Steroidobacteraceae bacterium]|nr:rhomboid family intramembrane serine protease [Steroidobacteraceae bacterium]
MFANIPPATRTLVLICVAVFLAEQLFGDLILQLFALWPPGSLFQPWQVISYAFLHAGWTHLLFNMFALWMFGSVLERYWGSRRYLVYYFACVFAAALVQMTVQLLDRSIYPTLGASGGIFGLLLAFAMNFPRQRIMLLFPPIPMPAWFFVPAYGLVELFLGVTGSVSGVAHFAHLGGMLGGAVVMLYWHARRARG